MDLGFCFRFVILLIVWEHLAEACTMEELVMVQMVVRHASNSPLFHYPEDPNPTTVWREGLDDLTMLGKFQSFALGCQMRRRYNSLITTDPQELKVISSAHTDSIKSALSLATAMYAPTPEWEVVRNFSWQPLVVQSKEESKDQYLSKPPCPVADSEYAAVIAKESKEIFEANQNLINYWQINSGMELSTLKDVEDLFDILEAEAIYNLTVPDWAKNYWNEMKYLHDLAFAMKVTSEPLRRLRGGPLVELTIEAMKMKTSDPTDPTKVIVYSTHGLNVGGFLSAMDIWNFIKPEPCTTALIELYKHEDEHFVRYLLLNSTTPEREHNVLYVMYVPGCTEFCPLDYIVNYTKDIIPDQWEEECQFS